MIAAQVGSKATRDALFLSSFAPEELPEVVIAAAGAAMLAVFGAARAFGRFGPARIVPLAFAASSGLFVAEWALQPRAPAAVAITLYLHTAIFGALVISGFWSVVNERFDPHSAKRVVRRIGVGATFGGVLGGVLAERIGALAHAHDMLAVLAGLNAVAAVGVQRIGGLAHAPEEEEDEDAASGMEVLQRAPYLRALGALVVSTAVGAGLLDYAFKAEAAAHFSQGSLLSFFAIFHTAAALLSLLLQTGLAKPALQKLGVAGTVATLPTVVLLGASAAALVPRLLTIVIARGVELVLANSIFRSGYELLYTPVAPERKRPTKALIDVAGNRLGDALGSTLTLAVLALAPGSVIVVVLALAAVVSAGSVVLARRLHRGYVRALEERLAIAMPATSTVGLDREALFEQVAAQQSWSERGSHPSLYADETVPDEPRAIDAPAGDPVHDAARTLRHGDAPAIRALLQDAPLDARLIPYAVALLARHDVYPAAIDALRSVAGKATPRLTEALLNPAQPFAIRRRIPRVLEVATGLRAADALRRALQGDPRFEVRYHAALALSRMARRDRSITPTPDEVQAVVRHELEAGRRVWDAQRILDEDASAPLGDATIRERIHRSLEHVFTVLSLAYDPEPLRLSLRALASDDPALRGTALEYLENVLPDGIREGLFAMMDARVQLGRRRSPEELHAELVRSLDDTRP